jgi:DNA-binding NarL/FixJ family response regulator
MPIRLVLADDHPIVLEGLTKVLESLPRYEVVGTATNGDDALSVIRAKAPAVAILDIRMPRKTGLEVAAAVLSQAVATRVVLLTAEITDADALEAIRLGVHGVILKGMGVALLLKCIDKVNAGGLWIERESMHRAFHHVLKRDTAPAPPPPGLTHAETRVTGMVVAGAKNKEIAERLRVSEGTVKSHLHSIYLKLKIGGRRDLARLYEQTRST